MTMSDTNTLTPIEFEALEEAVMETARGRAFLKEYARRSRVVGSDVFLRAVGEIREAMARQKSEGSLDILKAELEEMRTSILKTRQEIVAIKPEDAGNNRIMAATGELDAIVTATERATTEILGAAERLQAIGTKLCEGGADAAACDEIHACATNIFLACSFQDITGQRTTKVINLLRYIEQRVNSMIDIWGIEGAKPSEIRSGSMEKRPDADLVEGPQLEGNGVSQDDVDQMLDDESGMALGAADKQGLENGETPTMNGQQGEDESSELGPDNIDSLFN
jgi:chemotaxis regulatin CheY-phosphate phosphatase CheZ